MEIAITIISSVTLIILSALFLFYFYVSKKQTEGVIKLEIEMKQSSATTQKLIHDISIIQSNKYEELTNAVKFAQELANKNIKNGIENMQNENKNIQNEVDIKIQEIRTLFKDNKEKVENLLLKYNEENNKAKQESNKLKESMQYELQKILNEIKAPLELD